jgi:hypothetical protein
VREPSAMCVNKSLNLFCAQAPLSRSRTPVDGVPERESGASHVAKWCVAAEVVHRLWRGREPVIRQ